MRSTKLMMREDGQAVDDALYALAMGPDIRVRHYESCIVGDVRYNTLARDEGRKTQNNAIMSTDTYDKEITEMYANITDISSVCGSVVLSLV